jgi:hypothetical protein
MISIPPLLPSQAVGEWEFTVAVEYNGILIACAPEA